MISIRFDLNGNEKEYIGDENLSLLDYLRNIAHITSVKDGCSAQGACGACLVEINSEPALSCRTRMKKLDQAKIVTIEGFDQELRETLGRAFAEKGAVQCGFCSPGFLSRAKILLDHNPDPTRDDIVKALKLNLCRCTGYVKIVDAILFAASKIQKNEKIEQSTSCKVGASLPKLDAYQRAIGKSDFIADTRFENMLFGALKFSDHPRARILKIDCSVAERFPGVTKVFTANDIPGAQFTGILTKDWPLMLKEGETTRYIGDVIAGVVAESETIARKAVDLISVEYEVLEPLTDMLEAETSEIKVHPNGNLLGRTHIKRGEDIKTALQSSEFTVSGTYKTQRVEHAFLETEACVGKPWKEDGITLYVQSQGIYEDRSSIAKILALPKEKINVILVPCGGAFGGKEDMTVQGHAALYTYHLKRPVRVRLTREESLRMHPKRHPFVMKYTLGCDKEGMLTALKADIIGDTGAYASLGSSVLSRAAGHAAGGYHLPSVEIESKAVYTNNIPCGAMRGFGVNQVTFAMECSMDELCEKGGFDPWQFRYDNALRNGLPTTTGHVLKGGAGLRETLLAVKDDYRESEYAGLAIGIKNIGFGNGQVDESEVKIDIKSDSKIILHHGWTEMGQGIDTIAVQIFCEESGIDTPHIVEISHSTAAEVIAGATTASRGTFLLGNSIINAAQKLKKDLQTRTLSELAGKTYHGKWSCDWTNELGTDGEIVSHVAYSYAAQVVILNSQGTVAKVIAAHDVGKAINPTLLEGQIEGGVVMGLGAAFSENLLLEKGHLKSSKFGKLGIPRAQNIPEIDIRIIEVKDPFGPYGAKGIGEISLVPTAAAAANALYQYDRKRRYELPLKKGKR